MRKKLLILLSTALLFCGMQLKAFEATEAFNYAAGDLSDLGTAGNGWNGAWVKFGGAVTVTDGNLGYSAPGTMAVTGKPGSNTEYFRTLSDTLTQDATTSAWISFTMKTVSGGDWGGLSVYLGSSELQYIGNNGGYISLGDNWNRGNATINNEVFVLVKFTDSKVYLWANYNGTAEPDVSTADASKDWNNAATGFNKIRLGNGGNISIAYDDIRIADTYPAAVAVQGVTIDKGAFNLISGNAMSLMAVFIPTYATNQSVIWSSSDEAVATVDAAGEVTGVAAGDAEIMVTTTEGSFEGISLVKVWDDSINVSSISLNTESSILFPGGSFQLTASILPVDASNQAVAWSSSDEAIATVDATGKITAVAEGAATITALSVSGGMTSTCDVLVVKAIAVEKFNYPYLTDADKNRLQTRGTASNGWKSGWIWDWVMGTEGITPDNQYKINGTNDVFLRREFITPFPNTTDSVYWLSFNFKNLTKNEAASSNEPQWGSVYFNLGGGTKLVIGSTKAGGRKISMMDDWGGSVISTVADTLDNLIVVKIKMSGSGANHTATLFVNPDPMVEPADGDAIGSMGWWTNGKSIDQLYIGARNPFSAQYDNIRFAKTYGPITHVTEPFATEDFESYNLVDLRDLGTAENGWTGAWFRNGGSTMVIDGTFSSGKAIQTGGDAQYFRTLDKTYVQNADTSTWVSFTMQKASGGDWAGISVYNGSNELQYIGNNGGFVSLGDDWNRSDASIDNETYVLAKFTSDKVYLWANYTGVGEPLASTADASKNWSNAASGFNKIRIGNGGGINVMYDDIRIANSYPEITYVNAVHLNKKSFNVIAGATSTLTATMAPTYATEQRVTWQSSATSFATVANGVVTGVSAGVADIIVTSLDGAKRDTCVVTVWNDSINVNSISLNLEQSTLFPASTQQLTVTFDPIDATHQGLVWKSLNTDVATVDQDGLVTAITEGEAAIVVTSTSALVTDTFMVNVVTPESFEYFNYSFLQNADDNRLQNRGAAENGWKDKWEWDWVMGMDGITEDHQWKINGTADVFLRRQFVNPYPNVAGATYWLSYTYKNLSAPEVSSNEPQWGSVYFNLGGGTKLITGTTKSGGRKVSMMDDWGGSVISDVEDTLQNFVVVKIVMSGSGANNRAYLFVNPGTTEPANEDAVGDMGWWSNGQGINQVYVGARGSFSIVLDNIRMAKTYKAYTASTSIELSANTITLTTADASEQLVATINPEEASNTYVVWSSSDENIATVDANGVVTAVANGVATITVANFEGLSATCEVTVNIPTGIDALSADIKVYPVPAKNMLYVSNHTNISKVSIVEINGRVVKVIKTLNGGINVSDLDNGVYFLKIESGNKTNMKKFIIAR